MAGARQPIDLVVAKGKKHLGKAEIAERRAKEVKVPFTDIEAPDYLNAKQKEKFDDLAYKLTVCKIFTELDIDVLARYVVSHDLYLAYTSQLTKAIKKQDMSLINELQKLQNRAFIQADTCAKALGLTISSRCKIEIPVTEQEPKKNKFDKFEVV